MFDLQSHPCADHALHPIPASSAFCRLIPNFLSASECQVLIEQAEARGFNSANGEYPPSYRSNDRQVLDDASLAQQLLARLEAVVPVQWIADDGPQAPWELDSINARFRLCRYSPGQAFGLHQDGVHHRSERCRSMLTFMVYLDDASTFEGGDTVFYDAGPGGEPKEIGRVRPCAGSLIVFDHALWHAGAVLESGVKHVLRSDILYRRDPDGAAAASDGFATAHQGYVWALESLDAERFASAGRDTQIHIWGREGKRRVSLRGHSRSVLGLAALGPDRLASVSRDRSLRIWDTENGQCLKVIEDAHAATLLSVAALPDGRLVTSGADGTLKIWRSDGELDGQLAAAGSWAWSVAPLPEGHLACVYEDGAIRVWHVGTRQLIRTLRCEAPLRSLTVSADGQYMAGGDIDGIVWLWRQCGDAWVADGARKVHSAAVRRVRLLEGHELVSVGEDGAVQMTRLRDGRSWTLGSHANFATDVVTVGNHWFSCGYDGQIQKISRTRHEESENE